MHVRVAFALGDDRVHQALEPDLLALSVARPHALVARLGVIAELYPTEQILEAAGRLEPGMPFKVEPNVSRTRFGHKRETAVRFEWKQVDPVLAVPSVVRL